MRIKKTLRAVNSTIRLSRCKSYLLQHLNEFIYLSIFYLLAILNWMAGYLFDRINISLLKGMGSYALVFWGTSIVLIIVKDLYQWRQNKKTLFRFHRGSLPDSLETTIRVSSKRQLLRKIKKEWRSIFPGYIIGDIRVEPYGGIDERCGWDTYIVTVMTQEGRIPMGFTFGPLE